MTHEPDTDDRAPPPARRARFALSLDMEGMALMERTPVGWVRRGAVALNDEDFSGRMAVLRDEALAMGAGDGVEVWLPEEQVLPLSVRPEGPGPAALRRAVAAATPHPVEELTWDSAPAEDGVIVLAAWRQTVEEARGFAEKWDMPVTRVTTRAAAKAFPEGPVFELAPRQAPRAPARRPPARALAAAGALAALGFGLWLWLGAAPDLPNPAPDWTPPGGMAALDADGGAIREPAPASAPAPPVPAPAEPEHPAPLVERPPAPDAPIKPPRAAPADALAVGAAGDRAPPRAAGDAPPGRAEPSGAAQAPTPDQAAEIKDETDAPPEPDAPPNAAPVRRLAADVAPPPDLAPAFQPVDAPEALVAVSVLLVDPPGLDDLAPPPEVMGTEFAPPPPPPEPEDVADEEDAADTEEAADAEDAAADEDPLEAAEEEAASAEIPEEYLAGPDTPRPTPKPGDQPADEVAGPPPPPEKPATDEEETAAEDAASPDPDRPDAADAPSAHALQAAPRPLPKPVSAKDLAEAEGLAPTKHAALSAPRPGAKPTGLKLRAGALATARAKARDEARAAKAAAQKSASGGRQIPSSASLAAAATTRNAVELSETILVGVFGSSSSRRAILRLPNGDIKRVKTGESVEGWKVSSIGQSSIRLTRSGQSQTLNVPGE